MFPLTRLRRLRHSESLRTLTAESSISKRNLIAPLFVIPGKNEKRPLKGLEGHAQLSPDKALKEATELRELGYRSLIIFGIPSLKDEIGSQAWNESAPAQQTLSLISKELPDMLLFADVCLCSYTSHGHCGVIEGSAIANDASLECIAKKALSVAKAGARVVAPSGMLDGAVAAIRKTLDDNALIDTAILGYSAKYASALYGPFREAADSTPQFGDRRSYQMQVANAAEALREIQADIEEGADMIMIKPGLAYLDVIYRAKQLYSHPLGAYQVSGEYAMIKAAARQGLLNQEAFFMETLLAFRRAGADFIFTYMCREVAHLIE